MSSSSRTFGRRKIMCKYCEREKKLEERKDDNIYFTIYGRFLRVQGKVLGIPLGRAIKINYCPICGRKLGE